MANNKTKKPKIMKIILTKHSKKEKEIERKKIKTLPKKMIKKKKRRKKNLGNPNPVMTRKIIKIKMMIRKKVRKNRMTDGPK